MLSTPSAVARAMPAAPSMAFQAKTARATAPIMAMANWTMSVTTTPQKPANQE